MIIRKLALNEPGDFELLVLHVKQLYAELFGEAIVPSPEVVARFRQQVAERNPAHWAFLGLAASGEPICLATLAESFSFFARGHYGIINELWVRSDARSQGIGGAMLAHCQAFGRERGWERIDVSAPDSNA